jgi:ribosome-binding factor A
MKSSRKGHSHTGPSQRQLRAGELVRHALVDILREEDFDDPVLHDVSVTVSEVRLSPDFRHAIVFVEPLGAGLDADNARAEAITAGLNRAAKFLRGRLGKAIELRTIPDLKFVHDESFAAAGAMDKLFSDPRVRRDLDSSKETGGRTLADALDDEDED